LRASDAALCDRELMAPPHRRLVGTGAAARAVGVDPATLWRWAKVGRVTPELRTAGGQLRWDVAQLRQQLTNSQEEQPLTEAAAPEPQPVVAAIVTSELGVLVGRRNDGVPPWTFIAGEIEPGESPADAAIREVKEEAGLIVNYSRVIGRRVHPKTGRTMIYLACVPAGATDVHVGDPEELAEVRWASRAEVDALLPGVYAPVADFLSEELRN
jgi:8-oxo-dGTP pyrophosphatase MutT (NUDIX family)